MSDNSAKQILKAAPPPSANWRKPLRTGLAVAIVGFGGFVGWAVSAPLDSAVVASGVVGVEGSRQIVQHLEGGIVKQIDVRDGQLVQKGDLLFVLDDTSQRATLAALTTEMSTLRARETRLLAERSLTAELVFPKDLLTSSNPAIVASLDDERANFKQRRELREVQDDVLVNKKNSLRREIEGLTAERISSEQQRDSFDQEIPGLKELFKKGLTSLGRVTTLERERSRLEQTIARSMTDSAKADREIGDADLQIAQSKADWQSKVVTDLIETRRQMAEIGERINIAQDVLTRLDVFAPKTGVAQARGPSTIGAVVRPGDVLVEIAPVDQDLVINAKVLPNDVDVIKLDQNAEIRFPNFKAEESPLLYGKVTALSNDRIADPADPKQEYFFARVEIDRSELPKAAEERIRAGMTAEVIFPTGERSAGEYLLQPLTDRLRVAFRER